MRIPTGTPVRVPETPNNVVFYCELEASPKIWNLPEPDHKNWHTRALALLFSILPKGSYYLETVESPEYFSAFETGACGQDSVFIPNKESKLCRVIRKKTGAYRHQIFDLREFPQNHSWIMLSQNPILLSACDQINVKIDIVYYWDAPRIDIATNSMLDISPMLCNEWRRLNRKFPQLSRRPLIAAWHFNSPTVVQQCWDVLKEQD